MLMVVGWGLVFMSVFACLCVLLPKIGHQYIYLFFVFLHLNVSREQELYHYCISTTKTGLGHSRSSINVYGVNGAKNGYEKSIHVKQMLCVWKEGRVFHHIFTGLWGWSCIYSYLSSRYYVHTQKETKDSEGQRHSNLTKVTQ